MIAEPQFRNKTGSLARRILFIALTLLVLPLVLYSVWAFQRDYQSKLQDLFLTLDAVGKGQATLLEEVLAEDQKDLRVFADLLNLQNPSQDLHHQFQKIAQSEDFSTFVFLTKTSDGGTLSTFSSDPLMSGLPNLFSKEIQENPAFLGENPISLKKEIYAVYATAHGFLVAGHNAQKFICNLHLENTSYPFQSSLITLKDELFVSSDPAFSQENMQILTSKEIEKSGKKFLQFAQQEERWGFWNFFKKREGKIGLKISINGSNFSLLTDLPEDLAFEVSKSQVFSRLFSLILIIVVLGGGVTWLLVRRMARPLRALSTTMARVGEGHLSSRYQKDFLGFEINRLGRQFNQMVEGLIQYIEEVKTEKISKELLLKELKIGHEIQKSIFPVQLPETSGLQIASGFLPAREVTGDFYDLFIKDNTSLIFSIGDAAGKGISACLIALLLRATLRTVFHSIHASLSQIVEKAGELFYLDTQETSNFATAWIGSLDLKTGVLQYTSCGHLPALLVQQNGAIEEMTTPGVALGVLQRSEISTNSRTLVSGDCLFLCSDGVLEAHNPEGQLFGMDRLKEVLIETRDKSAQEMIQSTLQKIQEFSGKAPQHDDLTLLVIKIL